MKLAVLLADSLDVSAASGSIQLPDALAFNSVVFGASLNGFPYTSSNLPPAGTAVAFSVSLVAADTVLGSESILSFLSDSARRSSGGSGGGPASNDLGFSFTDEIQLPMPSYSLEWSWSWTDPDTGLPISPAETISGVTASISAVFQGC